MAAENKKLNSAQEKAVNFADGPLLIVAGAGTGKTTVITERIAHLIMKKNCQPEEILALTFTDKAAEEMLDRVDRLLPLGYANLWISTFHAFAEKILKAHALEIGLPNDFKLLNTTEQWLLVRKNLDKFNLDYYRPLGNPTKFIHALLKLFSRAKDENISPEDYLKYAEELKLNAGSEKFINNFLDEEQRKLLSKKEIKEIAAEEIKKQLEIAEAYHTYQHLLIENEALDFGDLISYCLKLFQTRKNILAKYRQQFKYVLVDEFQDTNYAQYELIRLLAAPKNNITVVGDDDQSIYKFRGASISNILQFKDDYPNTTEIFLNQNYRSCQNILDLSYNFIQKNNPYRLEVKLKDNGQNLSKKLTAASKKTGEILHLHGRDAEEEIRLVTEKIINLYNADKNTNWSDFCLLVRANSHATGFINALEQASVPFYFVASRGLYSKRIVLDIMAYLKLLDNYHESAALYRLFTLPFWDITTKDIINLNHFAKRKGWSLFEATRQAATIPGITAETIKKINKVIGLVEAGAQAARENKKTTEIVHGFLNDSGYLKYLTEKETPAKREEINYLNQFFKKITDFENGDRHRGLKDFMELMNLELESGEAGSIATNWEENGPDTVKIMTIHAAKGLEFKYVFIANLVEQRFPTTERGDAIELPEKLTKEIIAEGDIHLQEERRLFYVAATRAKEGLYLTSAEDYGGARKKKISRFLTELDEKLFTLTATIKSDAPALKPRPKAEDGLALEIFHLPPRFSFSQLNTFQTCPYQYRFAYVLGIPTAGKPHFSFGQSIHLTLQKVFQKIATSNAKQADLFGHSDKPVEITWPEMEKIYEESFIDDWYPTKKIKEDYFAKGKKALKTFWDKHQGSWPKTLYVENSFNLRLKRGSDSYTCFGRIDRIDEGKNGIRIIDYKTGAAKKTLSPEDKQQLLIYQMAAEEVLGQEVEELVFYYIEENKELSFLGKEKDLANLKDRIIDIIEEMKSGKFLPEPDERKCKFCDFNSICDFRA